VISGGWRLVGEMGADGLDERRMAVGGGDGVGRLSDGRRCWGAEEGRWNPGQGDGFLWRLTPSGVTAAGSR